MSRAAARVAVSRKQLAEAIREAHKQGASLRAIAEAAEVSHEQVRRVLNP